ncbi:unnamed protein product [Acanthoscelides obtectus]|uniref:Uncharacterized protein n=1 Tax=Acanthoscelides obtectus TaxID=200917 RepID=A0A9P0L776_ACAOB|nr:unnamed protein product [Acanthoscelides obtectus]CAK1627396.1 hypothetical protein AOBTE_LOCUS4569 [Acanthoscelides obtectus]
MKINVERPAIECCFRIGQYERDKKRPIVLKFSSMYYKQLAYDNKKLLKSSGMVIREDLTQYKLKLLKDAITKMGRNGRVWTTNGTIFCKYDGEGRTVKIEKPSDIAKL